MERGTNREPANTISASDATTRPASSERPLPPDGRSSARPSAPASAPTPIPADSSPSPVAPMCRTSRA